LDGFVTDVAIFRSNLLVLDDLRVCDEYIGGDACKLYTTEHHK